MSRRLPRPQLGDRGLGPAWAALPACTPLLRDQADGMLGRHCTDRLVPAATEAAQRCQAHWQRRDLALLVLLSAGSQEERGYHLPPAQPSSARRLGPFPAPPEACRSQGWSQGPAGLPGQGASTSSRDAEPWGSSLAQLGGRGGQPTSSLHPQPTPPHGAGRRDRPRGSQQCQRPPVRKSIHFITDLKSARGSASRIRFTRDVSIFQQGEEKRGTNPTDPTHGSLVLENTRWCSREKLWVRGVLAEMRGDASAVRHHPCPQTPAKNL